MSSTTKTIDVKKSLVDAILAGLIALIVFGPIVGVVLDGYGFNLQPTRVAWIVAIVMAWPLCPEPILANLQRPENSRRL
ncbi:hypothetical protein ABH907_001330 [Pseudomonas frederiksbergensis]